MNDKGTPANTGRVWFPFSDGTQFHPSVPTPWLGGMAVPISGGAGNANQAVLHGLNRVPRFCWLLDCGTNVNLKSPPTRGTTPWNSKTAFLNWPSAGAGSLLVFG